MGLGDGGEDDLCAWLDAKCLEWLSHVGQQAEVCVVDRLSLAANNAIGVVDLQVFYHSVVIDSQLRSLDVLLDFGAELLEVPSRIEVYLKLYLLSTWIPLLFT